MDRAAIMAAGIGRNIIQNHDFTAWFHYIRVHKACLKTADAVHNGRICACVVEINITIRREVRVEGNSQKTTLEITGRTQSNKRNRQESSVLYHTQSSYLLGDKQSAVRCELHAGWR